MTEITLEMVRQRAETDAKTNGYYLNPDSRFLRSLLEGLKSNQDRYGYPSCPCRLASGKFDFDRDIICPCDYRDPDVAEFGACYCALYVRNEVHQGKTELKPVPERRPLEKQSRAYSVAKANSEAKPMVTKNGETKPSGNKPRLWYCKQCGYVVFRDEPPYTCPICKAKKEMFEEIRTHIDLIG